MLVLDKNGDEIAVFVDFEVAQAWAADGSVASDGTSLYRWTGGTFWRELPELEADALAYRALRELFEAQSAPQLATLKHAKIAVQAAKLHLMSSHPMRDRTSEKIVPCANGYLRLAGRTLDRAEPAMYLQYSLNCNYVPETKAPLFEHYLQMALPDSAVQDRLQEFIGSLLISDDFGGHQLWVGIGAGPLGKIIRTFAGNAVMSTTETLDKLRLSTLLVEAEGYQSGKNTVEISRAVRNALANKSASLNSRFSTPSVLEVAGKLIVLAEHAPSISDPSESYWRRWDVISFLESHVVSETVIETELSGVLNWALVGLERLLERGCFADRPAGVKSLLSQTKSGSSSIHAWLEDSHVRVVAGSVIRKDTVYRAYCQWCDHHSVEALAVANFWTRLRQGLPGLNFRKKITDGMEIRYANLQIGDLALVSSG